MKKTIDKLNNLQPEECWYIVRQELNFSKQCYAADIVSKNPGTDKFQTYFEGEIISLNTRFSGEYTIPANHRMVVESYYYGLLKKVSRTYDTAIETDVLKKIRDRCSGDFQNIGLYQDIIDIQLEKMFITSNFEKDPTLRSRYALHPIPLILKVLLKIGEITGDYKITMDEFKLFVGTTEKYLDFEETVIEILAYRLNSSFKTSVISKIGNFTGNRFNLVLSNLSYLDVTNNDISIKSGTNSTYDNRENLEVILEKIKNYEDKKLFNQTDEDIEFLTSLNNLETITELDTPALFPNYKKKNRIIYGAPGTGKSHKLKLEIERYNDSQKEKTTFYADYTFGKFVGMFKPVSGGDYKYQPGAFLKILSKALKDPNHPYFLIIDEINRADAASTFGDIFQLLDRNDSGKSKYSIDISEDMKNYFEEEDIDLPNNKLFIPENLYIWATMNSADQGVYPLDSAFKRRWSMEYIDIDEGKDIRETTEIEFEFEDGIKKNILWNNFREKLNNILTTAGIREDKQIAVFFLADDELTQKDFVNKLLMYLSEDVFRHNKSSLFATGLLTYGKIKKAFEKDGQIFSHNELNDLFKIR